MKTSPIFQVDAFTEVPFAGNPAAVVLLDGEREAAWMQSVAAEKNLSETAFLRPLDARFELRWFTPACEVDLCGHATLASAHVLWSEGRIPEASTIRFATRSGELRATAEAGGIALDFPGFSIRDADDVGDIATALGAEPLSVHRAGGYLIAELADERTVRELNPDFALLGRNEPRPIAVTSLSGDPEHDYVCRFFAPTKGIDEDPVTGSAQCGLGPFWGARLAKTELVGFQASARGGQVRVQVAGDRVLLVGKAVTVLRGELIV